MDIKLNKWGHVWILEQYDYDYNHILGVFSTRDKAVEKLLEVGAKEDPYSYVIHVSLVDRRMGADIDGNLILEGAAKGTSNEGK